jgi:imidazolonepropionase-like amidohydrolase
MGGAAVSRLVLRDVAVFDGANPLQPGMTITIEGDRVAAVDRGSGPSERAADEGATVLELTGHTVIPGMFTCHFHSTYHELGSTPSPFGNEHPPAYQALLAARNLRIALQHGYTSAVSAGAANDVDASLRKAVDDGLIPGPRLVPGSRELSTTGHSNDSTPWFWGAGPAGAVRLCDGPEEFRKGVREEIKRGAQIIKLFVTGGHGTLAPRERNELTRDELAAAIDTAHARGALIRGHIANKDALLMAVELGIDIVDHGDAMDDECIAALVEAGTFVVPSVFFPKHFGETIGAGLGFADNAKAEFARACDVLPKANAAGVRFLVGDDYGAVGFPHGLYGRELSLYVDEVGIAAHDVLRWATRNGAALVGREGELGTVAPGALADLVIVRGDPLASIGLLSDPDNLTVVKGGVVQPRP